MTAAASKEWTAGVHTIHKEAAGVLTIEIIRAQELASWIAEARGGSGEAKQMVSAACEFIRAVRGSPRNRPMLCGCCPRSIRSRPFAVGLVFPSNEAATKTLTLGICDHCGTEMDVLRTKAKQALTEIWPDLRPIVVTGPGGHA